MASIRQITLPDSSSYYLIDLYGRQMLASDYAVATAYSVGDYVIYNDELYRVTVDISAVANTQWSDVTKTKTSVGAEIQNLKSQITKVIHYRGITTTALADGDSTNPITINGNSYTAVEGDLVIYNSMEFLYDGTIWQELGSTGTLGQMAFVDTASGTASVSVSGSTSGVAVSIPYTVTSEVLTIGSPSVTQGTVSATGSVSITVSPDV